MAGTIDQQTGVFMYAFSGRAGQNVTITMLRTSGDVATSLHLYAGDNLDQSLINIRGENLLDPTVFADAQHTAIVFYTLPEDGPYVIRAGRNGWWYNSNEGEGAFTLTLDCDTDFGAQTRGGRLTCGTTVNDWIYGSNAVDEWVFMGQAGQNVTVTMLRTSGDMTMSLHLYSATNLDQSLINIRGENLLDPTVFADAQHTAVVFYTLPEDGPYVIRAGRNGWWYDSTEGEGAFTLTLECDTDFGTQTRGGRLTCGTTVNDWIYGSNAVDEWVFEGRAGQNVTVTMLRTSGDMTMSLHLYSAANLDQSLINIRGKDLLDSTVFDDPQHTAVVFYTLPDDGVYVIRAGRNGWWYDSTEGEGAFTLTFECDTDFGTQTRGGRLTCGTTVNDWIYGSNAVDEWIFAGQAGQNVAVTMLRTSGDMTMSLHLYSATNLDESLINSRGENLLDPTVFDDPQHTAVVFFTLPEDGTYVIRAGRNGWWYDSAEGDGAFTLTLNCDADFGTQTHGGSLTCGSSTTDWIYGSNSVDTWTFEGTANSVVTVTMTRLEGDMVSAMRLFSATDMDTVLVSNTGPEPGQEHLILMGTNLAAEGLYVIRAGREGWWYDSREGDGMYLLTLSCAN